MIVDNDLEMGSSITDSDVVLSINAGISDEEINVLQYQQEHEKVIVKESEKAAELLQRFLKINKNFKTEAFDAIAMLEKTVQMQKDVMRWKILIKDVLF